MLVRVRVLMLLGGLVVVGRHAVHVDFATFWLGTGRYGVA